MTEIMTFKCDRCDKEYSRTNEDFYCSPECREAAAHGWHIQERSKRLTLRQLGARIQKEIKAKAQSQLN